MKVKNSIVLVSLGLFIGFLLTFSFLGGFSDVVTQADDTQDVQVEVSENCHIGCNPTVYLADSGNSSRVLVEVEDGRSANLYSSGDLTRFSEVSEGTTVRVYAFQNNQEKILIAEERIGSTD